MASTSRPPATPSYPQVADSCREVIWDTAAQVIRVDIDVILDWNMWSRERRADTVRRAAALGSRCQLHYLRVPLDVAIPRAQQRDDPGAHRLDATGIRHLKALFEPPEPSEGFILYLHRPSDLDRQYRELPNEQN